MAVIVVRGTTTHFPRITVAGSANIFPRVSFISHREINVIIAVRYFITSASQLPARIQQGQRPGFERLPATRNAVKEK